MPTILGEEEEIMKETKTQVQQKNEMKMKKQSLRINEGTIIIQNVLLCTSCTAKVL